MNDTILNFLNLNLFWEKSFLISNAKTAENLPLRKNNNLYINEYLTILYNPYYLFKKLNLKAILFFDFIDL